MKILIISIITLVSLESYSQDSSLQEGKYKRVDKYYSGTLLLLPNGEFKEEYSKHGKKTIGCGVNFGGGNGDWSINQDTLILQYKIEDKVTSSMKYYLVDKKVYKIFPKNTLTEKPTYKKLK